VAARTLGAKATKEPPSAAGNENTASKEQDAKVANEVVKQKEETKKKKEGKEAAKVKKQEAAKAEDLEERKAAEESGTENDDDRKKEESDVEDQKQETEGNSHDVEDPNQETEGNSHDEEKKSTNPRRAVSQRRAPPPGGVRRATKLQKMRYSLTKMKMMEETATLPRRAKAAKARQLLPKTRPPASSNFQALHPCTNISPSVAILKEKFEEARQHDEEDLKKKATASAMDTSTDVT
jgi:hypothetical protein